MSSYLQSSLFFLLLICLIVLTHSRAQAREKNILYLNSYHVGYKWSDELYQGFVDSLAPAIGTYALHVEYLDMKRNYSPGRYSLLAQSFQTKYKDIQIDAIVSADDAAFLFLKDFGADIFPGVPVFFCGTNYLESEDIHALPRFHGITEEASIEETFRLVRHILPQAKKMYIINDLTVTGKKVRQQLVRAMENFSSSFEFILWEDLSMPDLIARVNEIEQDSVVFYTFFFRDNTGQLFEYDQAMNLIYRQCPVPIFGAWDFNLGHGLAGGMLTSGYQQGKGVAQLVNLWLDGAALQDLPRLSSSPNSFMFDHAVLQKFRLENATLPENSIIINKPRTFYQQHRLVILGFGVFIVFLITIIMYLTTNIVQRRRAEEKLRQSEKNYRSIFTNASDGLYQSTEEGRFLQVNPALAKMLKFSSPAALLDYYTDIDRQLYLSPEERLTFLLRQKESGWAKGEFRLRCKDGSIIDVIEKSHIVHDSQGKFLYREGSITNLTEYKQTQELIAQTEKIISLGGVSAGIAHEIRSPVSSIIQGAQVITSRIFENSPANLQCAKECDIPLESIRKYLRKRSIDEMMETICESGKRAGTIIEDMLSFSKKTIGDFSLESVEDLLEAALELCRKDYHLSNECNFSSIEIVKEYGEDLPRVYCSSSKIRQVFFNILKNGVEAMGEAGIDNPRFIFRTYVTRDGVSIEIEDNGPGMEPELASQIFDPFFTTKDRERGTGLGLSVSYFIISENHHGTLKVTSQPGQGATFTTTLPLDQAISPASTG